MLKEFANDLNEIIDLYKDDPSSSSDDDEDMSDMEFDLSKIEDLED